MDRTIEKKGWSATRWAISAVLGIIVIVVIWQLVSRSSTTRLSVDPSRLTTAAVRSGTFLEYYPFDGTVQPATSVYLDVEEGGRVDQIFAEGGQHVEKGDLILRFSNASLQQTTIGTETQVLYNLDIQRSTQHDRAVNLLLLKETLLDLDHQIIDAQNKEQRYQNLMKEKIPAISKEDFETQHNQLQYLKEKRDLMAERIKQEDEVSAREISEAQKSIDKLNTSLKLLQQMVENLSVRAPISGYLSTIDAQVGQNINAGQRIGQIDLLDKLKVNVSIDQYYISRVQVGTIGHVNLDGRIWDVKIQKVYPEVKSNAFAADAVFVGETPASLKRGQTLTIELTFGAPSQSLIVNKGSFYQETSGRWVYLVSKDGRTARKTEVHLGRQNPLQVEVLDGLHEGDRIITSGYDTFNSVDELEFTDSINSHRGTS
ncbi:MAG TPA: efflux RND transporter periplasmic adaptor subunit [Steroidobacteraceae bacterium]|jgi:HlyD family secretion protein|nr:efflux RND transporter periplasmic adaptor subunit [Steroidobacteraceae bacterium]